MLITFVYSANFDKNMHPVVLGSGFVCRASCDQKRVLGFDIYSVGVRGPIGFKVSGLGCAGVGVHELNTTSSEMAYDFETARVRFYEGVFGLWARV